MDQKEKDRIAAEIAAEYRNTIRETAAQDQQGRSTWSRPKGYKSIGVTYFLWFFLGGLGVHRFYMGYPLSGTGMMLLQIFAILFALMPGLLVFGYVMGAAIWIWWLIDAFLIPRLLPDPPDY